MEVVSLGEEVEAGGSWKAEGGCQEGEVELETRMMAHRAEEVLMGQQQCK